MRKLLVALLVIVPTFCVADIFSGGGSGGVTPTSTCSGGNQFLTWNGSTYVCGTAAGGGASTLQTTLSGVQVTSPTSSMNFSSSFFNVIANGSTSQIYVTFPSTVPATNLANTFTAPQTLTSSMTITGPGGLNTTFGITGGTVTSGGQISGNNFNATGSAAPANGFTESAANVVTLYTNGTPGLSINSAQNVAIPNNLVVQSSLSVVGPAGAAIAYGISVGSVTASSITTSGQMTATTYQGGGLATCGDGSHALNWSGGSYGCQTLTGGGGGGASSLAVGTGTSAGWGGPIASSPTAVLLGNSNDLSVSLIANNTAFLSLAGTIGTSHTWSSNQTFNSSMTLTGPLTMGVGSSSAAAVSWHMNSSTTAFTAQSGYINFWADSSSAAVSGNFNNSGSTYTFLVSSIAPVAGQFPIWVANGPNAWVVGSSVPAGSGGGSGSGTITSSPQFQVPFYSASGTSNVLASSPNFSNNGSTITITGINTEVKTNVSSVTATGVLFVNTSSSMTISSETVTGSLTMADGAGITGSPIRAESYGASPSASASANQTAIQNAINAAAGGEVTLLSSGTFQVSTSLILPQGGNIRVRLGPNTHLLEVTGGAEVPLLETYNFSTFTSSTQVTISSLTSTSFQVIWPSNGITSTGTYVWLSGSSPTYYNGIFNVSTITNSGLFTVQSMRISTGVPMGTAYAKIADQNISIQGGIWDCNYPTNTSNATAYLNQCLMFGAAENVSVRDVKVNNSRKYTMTLEAVRDVYVNNWGSDVSFSDGIKIYGPAYNVDIDHSNGNALGDDGISISPNEAPAFLGEIWDGGGDCDRISINHTSVNSSVTGGAAVAIYPDSVAFMGNVSVDGVNGIIPAGAAIVNIEASLSPSTGVAQNIELKNITGYAGQNGQMVNVGGNYVQVNSLTIDGFSEDVSTGTGNLINEGSGATIYSQMIRNFSVSAPNWGSGSASFVLSSNANLSETVIENGVITSAVGGSGRLVSLNETSQSVGTITMRNINKQAGGGVLSEAAGITSLGTFIFEGGDYAGSNNSLVSLQGPANVLVMGTVMNNMNNGVIRVTGSVAVNYTLIDFDLISGSTQTTVSGSPTLNSTVCDMVGNCTMSGTVTASTVTITGPGLSRTNISGGVVYSSSFSAVNASSATTVTSYVPTNLSAQITPKSTSSRVKITVSGTMAASGAVSAECDTNISTTGVVTTGLATNPLAAVTDVAVGVTGVGSGNFSWIDSPATTSARTYTVIMKAAGTTPTCTYNSGSGTGTASIFVEDIGPQ